jgi:hypothetical protein
MKQLFLLLLFMALSGSWLNAQHCPYDAEGLIVVNIHTRGDTSIIPALKVTLVDSLGLSIMTPDWDFRKYLTDTLKFWQNPARTTFKGKIDCNNPVDPTRVRFPFANNNYVLMCPVYFKAEKYKIKIEDTDGEENGGCFETVILQLKNEDIYPLCGTYNMKNYPDEYDGKKNKYKPIEIKLNRQ